MQPDSTHIVLALLAVTAIALPSALASAEQGAVGLEAALGFRRFEQQVKSEIGGARGERLVEETEFSVNVSGAYPVWKWFGLGAFARWDTGTRRAGRFEGLDDEGRTVVDEEIGGAFQELWFGPLLRFQLDWFRASLGYGALGARIDDARNDLPADGDTDSALRTSATVSWLVALDAAIPTRSRFRPLIRIEYRVRYYDRRADAQLDDQLVHGTQNLTPLVGVAANF